MSERGRPYVVMVGQKPPPFHGQAVVTETLMSHRWSKLQVVCIPMRYSHTTSQVGQLGPGKVMELLRVIARTIKAGLRKKDAILYYPPASSALIPIWRDIIYLGCVRWFFRGRIYHFHARGLPEYLEKQPLLGKLVKWSFGRPTGVVEISEVKLGEAEYFEASKRFVVKNGLKISKEYAKTRAEFGLPVQGLFLGIMCRAKGIHNVLGTIVWLKNNNFDINVSFAGSWASKEEETNFLSEVKKLGLEENVSLLGELFGEEKWKAYAAADFFFFPSEFPFENFPLVLIEALGCGLPVVTSDWGGIPEIVKEGKTGFLASPQDFEAHGTSIKKLFGDQRLHKKMSEEALGSYAMSFTEERFISDMEGVFLETWKHLKKGEVDSSVTESREVLAATADRKEFSSKELERGVLYIGTGEMYREEIRVSLRSLRVVMPDIPVMVISDEELGVQDDHLVFERIEEPQYAFLDKVAGFPKSPFERTLFLDTDTYVVKPLDEVFELLNKFELLGAHEVAREHDVIEPLPQAFPEINTGVLAYRRCPRVENFLKTLLETYEPVARKVIGDQTAFRYCLYQSDLRIYVLPAEYNCQIRQAGYVGDEVKILHGRNINLQKTAQRINRRPTKRVFFPSVLCGGTQIIHFSRRRLKSWSALWLLLKRLGFVGRKS